MFSGLFHVVDDTNNEANEVIIPHVLCEKRCRIFRHNQ